MKACLSGSYTFKHFTFLFYNEVIYHEYIPCLHLPNTQTGALHVRSEEPFHLLNGLLLEKVNDLIYQILKLI